MSLIEKIQRAPTLEPSPSSLEDVLKELEKLGRPRLHRLAAGWVCLVEMNTTAPGANFDVRSEFGIQTPGIAAVQCLHRAQAAVKAGSPT